MRDVDLGALLPWVNFVLHYVMPVAIVLDWLLKPPVAKLQAQHLALALVFSWYLNPHFVVDMAARIWSCI